MDNPPKWLKFAPKIALAVSIGKMDDIYKTIAYKLNDKGKIRLYVTPGSFTTEFLMIWGKNPKITPSCWHH